jgi:hypothetical protein
LDINLEPEGEEYGEYPEDENIEEGIEVVEEPVSTEPQPEGIPLSPPPEKRKSRKKVLLTITIVVLVILAIIIIYIYFPRAPSDVEVIATESDDGHALRLNALIASESATESSGKAKITISFEGKEVYSNEKWNIESNDEKITIPYNEFVSGNGIHAIEVEFQGVSGTTTYDVEFVIEDVTISVFNPNIPVTTKVPEFTLITNFELEANALPKDAEVQIVEIVHKDISYQVTSGIGEWESVIGQGEYQQKVIYEESGNYTITVEIRNNDVKSDSEYYDFEVNEEFMINSIPIAKIVNNDDDNVVTRGTTVTFYGTSSVDDSQDNHNIILYDWWFEDTNEHEYGPEVDHTFNFVNPDPDDNQYWTVMLTITDDGHGEEQESAYVQEPIKVLPG